MQPDLIRALHHCSQASARSPGSRTRARLCAGAHTSGAPLWKPGTRSPASWERTSPMHPSGSRTRTHLRAGSKHAPLVRSPTCRVCTRRRIAPLNQLATGKLSCTHSPRPQRGRVRVGESHSILLDNTLNQSMHLRRPASSTSVSASPRRLQPE